MIDRNWRNDDIVDDIVDKPKPKREKYECTKCDNGWAFHYVDSDIGKKHLKYKYQFKGDMDTLARAIIRLEDKVNFHCERYPERTEGCSSCVDNEECDGDLIRWTCDSKGLPFFKEALEEIGVDLADRDEYVTWVVRHGGYCDCEVIFNAQRHHPDFANEDSPTVHVVRNQDVRCYNF